MQNTAENNDSMNQSAEKECLDAILKTTKMGIYSMNVLFSKMKKNEKILNFLQKQVELYKFVEKKCRGACEKMRVRGVLYPSLSENAREVLGHYAAIFRRQRKPYRKDDSQGTGDGRYRAYRGEK